MRRLQINEHSFVEYGCPAPMARNFDEHANSYRENCLRIGRKMYRYQRNVSVRAIARK